MRHFKDGQRLISSGQVLKEKGGLGKDRFTAVERRIDRRQLVPMSGAPLPGGSSMPRHDQLAKDLLRHFLADLLRLAEPRLAAELRPEAAVFLDKELFTALPEGRRHPLYKNPVPGGGRREPGGRSTFRAYCQSP
jgi:hypothetical protein